MMFKFTIPYKITAKHSQNGGKSWYVEDGVKKDIEAQTMYAMRAAGIQKTPIQHVARISIYYNSRLDVDNHGRLAKGIIDGIRYYGLLADDNKNHVRGLYQDFTEDPGISVCITECLDMPITSKPRKDGQKKNEPKAIEKKQPGTSCVAARNRKKGESA